MNEPQAQPQEAELVPCPFCPSSRVMIWVSEKDGEKCCCGFCEECQAEGPHANTEEEAARLWNTRVNESVFQWKAMNRREVAEGIADRFYPSETEPFESLALHLEEVLRQREQAIQIEALMIAAADVCTYCGGRTLSYNREIYGPNEAGNYTHHMAGTTVRDDVLCSASVIHNRLAALRKGHPLTIRADLPRATVETGAPHCLTCGAVIASHCVKCMRDWES